MIIRHYNIIAGTSTERLAALSDGVFAVAMTLLVLDLHTPLRASIHSDIDLLHALRGLAPQLISYMMSFLTLGIFWVGQQTQLNFFTSADRDLTWVHLGFLFSVSLMPFSTSFMAGFFLYRVALVVYWLNILMLGGMLFWSWRLALAHHLVADEGLAHTRAIERRILVSQALYAFGALLCVFSTVWSVVVIVLLQLNYALAPKWMLRLLP